MAPGTSYTHHFPILNAATVGFSAMHRPCTKNKHCTPDLPNGGTRHIGSCVSCIVYRCGYGKPEFELYLHQGSRKRQWRGKTADKSIGRTRGGLNKKLHAIVDGLGSPVEFMLPAGNDHDSVHAVKLLETVEIGGGNI